jgi:NAD(P)-dependent dehydrogenase (short-subunit alcohol dehydrogenase family)
MMMTSTADGATRTALEAAQEFAAETAGKIFVITGAYSGIGIETTKALLQVKAKVVVCGRNRQEQDKFIESLKKDFDPSLIDGHVVDLGDLSTIKTFADYVNGKYEKIDCLINNAGVMNTQASLTKDGLETQIGVNVVGHFLLTKLLLPKLVKAKGRQVWLSSDGHMRDGGPRFDLEAFKNFKVDDPSYDGWHQYQQSKLGDILLAKEFAARHQVEAVSCHPGVIKTRLGRHITFLQFIPLLFHILRAGIKMKSAKQGAATTVTCATLPSDNERFVNGAYYRDCEVGKPADSADNEEDRKALYDYCDEFTKKFQ